MNPRLARLIPPIALAALVAAAALSTASVSARPLAQVYERTHALAGALQVGDVERILELQGVPPASEGDHAERVTRIEGQLAALQGRPYVLTALDPQTDGSYVAQIRWLPSARAGGAWALQVRWAPDPEGGWRLQ